MQESAKLHTHCPTCQAPKDFDTPGARHYTCATYGLFHSGVYVAQCRAFPRVTCPNCDALADLVQAQAEEIKKLRAALAATGCDDIMCNEALRKCVTCKTRKG